MSAAVFHCGRHILAKCTSPLFGSGTTVNFAARVCGMAAGAEVWLSDDAKSHIDQHKAARHRGLKWLVHTNCRLKGFGEEFTLWSTDSADQHTCTSPPAVSEARTR